MTDPHRRHNPTNAKRMSNDFATKGEVVLAVKNMTANVANTLTELDARLSALERPWYVRLWSRVRG